jgi:tetratricopeptide (TPR) repeat protein
MPRIIASLFAVLLLCCVDTCLSTALAPEAEPEPPAAEEDPAAVKAAAFKLYKAEDYEGAVVELNRYLTMKPDDVGAINVRSGAHGWLGNWDEALEDCDRVIELLPKRADAWNTRGTIYRQKGDFLLAIDDFEKALELKPKSGRFHANIAECLATLGNEPDAIKEYDRALELEPDYMLARMLRVNCYRVLGDYDRAATEATAVLKLDPKAQGMHYQLGEQARKQGKFDEALKLYTTAQELTPFDFSIHVALADVYATKGDKAAAQRELDAALDEHAERVELCHWRAWSSCELACLYSVRSTTHDDTEAGKQSAKDDLDRAFRLLRTSLRRGFASFELLDHDQDMKALRKDERWKDIQKLLIDLEAAEAQGK